MNIALSPQKIPIPWEDYVSGYFDRAMIPWARFRYSKDGVIEVSGEVLRNVDIAGELYSTFRAEIKRSALDWKCYMNSISLEVELSDKEERIPDVMVITKDTHRMIGDESRIVTFDMPAPILVIEVISPSSVKEDLEVKPFEYMHRGVGEYVAIDWRKERVQVWSHTDGKNYNFVEYGAGERMVLNSFPELKLSVDDVITG